MSVPADKQYRNLSIAVIIALGFGAYFLRGFISLIIIAAIMALVFNPIYQRILKKVKRPGAAASLTFVASLFIIIIPLTGILFITYFQAKHIIDSFSGINAVDLGKIGQEILNSINSFLSHIPGAHQVTTQSLTDTVNKFFTTALQSFIKFVTSSVGSIISLFTSLIIYIYVFLALLMYQNSIINTAKSLNPLGDTASNTFLQKMADMTKAMVRGQFIIASLQGLAGALSFYIIGAHNVFVFLWLIFSVLCLIPLGSGIIIIPAGILMILFGDVWQGLVVLGTHFLITTNIDNVLRPRLVPKSARLNPALTILAVFAGIGMFGFLGIVVGPVIMILVSSTIEMYLTAKKARA